MKHKNETIFQEIQLKILETIFDQESNKFLYI